MVRSALLLSALLVAASAGAAGPQRLEPAKPLVAVLDLSAAAPEAAMRESLEALSAAGVPVVAIDPGAARAASLERLEAAGLGGLIPEENVVGAEARLPDAASALPGLAAHFPDHELISFDGAALRDRAALEEALALSPAAQRAAAEKDLRVEGRPARELPLVLPAARPDGLTLHIGVSDDLRTLTYSRVADDAGARRVDGGPERALPRRLERLAEFPSGGLLSPLRTIAAMAESVREAIKDAWGRHKRYTTYRGVTVSWDNDQDRHVWTTNIDTVFLIDRLEKAGVLDDRSIRKAAEIGVGGGQTAATLASRLPALSELTVTDISLYALRAARRAVGAYLRPGVRLRSFLGKGVKTLPGGYDLIVVNPPYIPVWPGEPGDEKDPYRGTGLIREIVGHAASLLNPANPRAAVVINISSMAEKDFHAYLKDVGAGWKVERLGEPLDVPLRIVSISDKWKSWLVEQGGLRYDPAAEPDREPYEHTLRLYKLTRGQP